MPRVRMPFYRASRKLWYVQLDGKQINLGPDEAEAWKEYYRLMAARGEKPPAAATPDHSPLLVVEVLDAFLDWCQKNRSKHTYESYLERLQSFTDYLKANGLSGMRAEALKPFHVLEWADSHPTWSPGTKRGWMGAVQRAFNHAAESGRLPASPVAKLKKPSQGRRENIVDEPTFEAMMKAVSPRCRELFTAARETGARPQELFRVEAKHVDLPGRRWVFEVKSSKGNKRVRVVYLTEKAFELTRQLVARHPAGPLFRNRSGRPWNGYSVGCVFSRLKEKLGKRYALYDLRHSWATRMLKGGVGVVTVANLMGHSNPGMVANVYQHLDQDPGHLREALNRVMGKEN
jgi:integrase